MQDFSSRFLWLCCSRAEMSNFRRNDRNISSEEMIAISEEKKPEASQTLREIEQEVCGLLSAHSQTFTSTCELGLPKPRGSSRKDLQW